MKPSLGATHEQSEAERPPTRNAPETGASSPAATPESAVNSPVPELPLFARPASKMIGFARGRKGAGVGALLSSLPLPVSIDLEAETATTGVV